MGTVETSAEWTMDLERGLRSSKPGVQLEVILRLGPRLQRLGLETLLTPEEKTSASIEMGSDPALSNALVLRLGETFRTGSKANRIAVLKVFLLHLEGQVSDEDRQILASFALTNFVSSARVEFPSSSGSRSETVTGAKREKIDGGEAGDLVHLVRDIKRMRQDPGPVGKPNLHAPDEIKGSGTVQEEKLRGGLLHPSTLLNPALLLKRIKAVICDDDPTVRSLALRMIGCMCQLAKDDVDVYRLILEALDSPHQQEAEAAYFACAFLATSSPAFADVALDKVVHLASAPSSPPSLRCRAIWVLSFMGETPELALEAHQAGENIFRNNPCGQSGALVLHSLTTLAWRSWTTLYRQVKLLLSILSSDLSTSIQSAALEGLLHLLPLARHVNPTSILDMTPVTHQAPNEKSIPGRQPLAHAEPMSTQDLTPVTYQASNEKAAPGGQLLAQAESISTQDLTPVFHLALDEHVPPGVQSLAQAVLLAWQDG